MFFSSLVLSQQKQSQLAFQYYQNGQYEEAILIYKELNKKTISATYYSPYISCLIMNKDYKKITLPTQFKSKLILKLVLSMLCTFGCLNISVPGYAVATNIN